MSTTIIARPKKYSACGGVWRNPIEYRFNSTLEFVVVRVYRVGATSDTLINTIRKRVINGLCIVDVSSSLRDAFVVRRDYIRNAIQSDADAAFLYYIEYSFDNGVEPTFVSDSIVPRMVFLAALESVDSDYIKYVLGNEPATPAPGTLPEPVVVYFISSIFTSMSTIEEQNEICAAPAYARVYPDAETITFGVKLYSDEAKTLPVFPGFARIFLSATEAKRISIGLAGTILSIDDCE